MGTGIAAAMLVGALSSACLTGCRAPDQSAAVLSGHALSGVVKSVDATRLVIRRAGKNPGEMTFVLSPTTLREGPIAVGTTVQVRFRTEGRTRVATAILSIPPK